jgi:hypothetical protein
MPSTHGNSAHFKSLTIDERIRALSTEEGGCLVYNGQRSRDGYGRIFYKGKRYMVHRVMWEIMRGPIPEGMQLDHKVCDNEPCWNPDHLEVSTPRVNVLRSGNPAAQNAQKTHCINGHEFTEETTVIRFHKKRGTYFRECTPCQQVRQHRAYLARKASNH